MNETDNTQLLTELETNLKKQLEFARRGNMASVEEVAGQCQTLVEKIRSAGLIEKPEYKSQRQRIEKLYNDLMLLLSSQKTAVAEQLKSISRGRKTLATYRSNI
jgi:ribosomal protein S20